MGGKVFEICHIGSASIPGIPAKPIIDVLAAVKTLAGVEPFTQDLNKVGYSDCAAIKGPAAVHDGNHVSAEVVHVIFLHAVHVFLDPPAKEIVRACTNWSGRQDLNL
jgi:GrpB-like predicted nucleotidyltransferase (UPF0157 family)